MQNTIYADRIGSIHITGGVVRIDLMTFQPQLQAENGQPVFNLDARVILPLEGFIQAFQLQEGVVKQLIQNGIVVNKETEEHKQTAENGN